MAEDALSIVHCLRAPVGGLFRHVCDLAAEQSARGHAVGIVADSRTGGADAEARLEALRPRCRLGIARLPMGRLPGPGDVSAVRAIGALLRDWRPDVLHGHGAKGGAHARLAAGRSSDGRRPLRVYTPHGGSLHYRPATPAGFLFLTMERALLARTDLLLFESDYGRRVYREKVGAARAPQRVVHNGLAPTEFTPIHPEADAADFVFVGELRALKGPDVLLAALAHLANRAEAPTAIVAGDGADRADLERRACALGLAGRIRFVGPMPARAAFARARCLVVPSRAESLPYVVIEGLAAGMPVIATDVGGVAEIFGAARDRLVPPGDDAALAGAMAAFLDDPVAARDAAGAMADDIGRRFTVAAMTEAVLDAYAEALGRRST